MVVLCLEKSPELIVALLGVLKTGAAYLPLRPGQPADRLAHLVSATGAALVLVADDAGPEQTAALSAPTLTPTALAATTPRPDGTPPATAPEPPPTSSPPRAPPAAQGRPRQPPQPRLRVRGMAAGVPAGERRADAPPDGRTVLRRVHRRPGARPLLGRHARPGRPRPPLRHHRLYRTMRQERVDCAEFVPAVVRGLMDHCERDGLRMDFLRLLVVGSDAWSVGEYRRWQSCADPPPGSSTPTASPRPPSTAPSSKGPPTTSNPARWSRSAALPTAPSTSWTPTENPSRPGCPANSGSAATASPSATPETPGRPTNAS